MKKGHDEHHSERIPIRRNRVDVRDLLTSTLEVLSEQGKGAGIGIHVSVDDDVPAEVPLDGVKVAWAVSTLVGNSLRYLGRSGGDAFQGPRDFVGDVQRAQHPSFLAAQAESG